ncbi:MAG: hypothetical protein V4750_18630 [Pseudomonadota bacterium]
MNGQIPLLLLLSLPLCTLATWAATRWFYRRSIRRLTDRITKIQVDREALTEQVKRARQQLGQVQLDMATWRKAVATARQAQSGAKPAEPQAATAPAVAAATAAEPASSIKSRLDIPSGLVFEMSTTQAHGFADTQPFEEAHAYR